MKVFFHLLRQELREKRLFFLGLTIALALFLGVGAAASLFHSQLKAAAEGLATLVVVGLVLAMGGGWLIRGFGAGGRRGFELARPLRAWQLGAAKLVAILLMAGAGGLFVLLPDLALFLGLVPEEHGVTFGRFASHGFPLARLQNWADSGWLPHLAVDTLMVLFGLVLVQTVAFPFAARRLRSLVTLGALVLFWTSWSWSYDRVSQYHATGIGIAALPLMFVAFAALGLFAAWRSFSRGLLAAAHRAFSRTMSAGLLALAALFAAGSVAATRPDFGKLLAYHEATASPDGSYWLVAGHQDLPSLVKLLVGERHLFITAVMRPAFLLDPGLRQATYLAEPRYGRRAAAFSAATGGGGVLLVELLQGDLWVSRLPEFREIGRLPSPFPQLSWQAFQLLIFRVGSSFDLVAVDPGQAPPHGWQVQRYRLYAAAPALEEAGSWRFPAGDRLAPKNAGFWAAALALLDAGLPPERIVSYQDLVPLAAGGFLALPADPAEGGWRLLDARGEAIGPLDLPEEVQPVGELRPGLLLATYPIGKLDKDWQECRQETGDAFTTLVVETSSGRILRQLPGFAAKANCTGDGRVWLVGPYGEPYDLGSVESEPARILPWRPLPAAGREPE